MLSKNKLVKFKKALKGFYNGKCRITCSKEIEAVYGITKFIDEVILDDEPCRLSHSSVTIQTPGEVSAKTNQRIKLFMDNTIPIPEGARIRVIQNDIETDYRCSGTALVFETHQEIELILEKERA